MSQLTCPGCQQQFDSEKSTAMPFCSMRCKMIDLGRWMNEDYGLPIERAEGEAEEFTGYDN